MSDSIGARLRQARELRHLTLPQVSETTKLRTHYLQALESDDYSAIPSAAQARGFLRIYAEFLELDMAALLPPTAAVEPLPAPEPAPMQAPKASPAPSAVTNLLANLRQRFSRPKKEDALSAPLAAPAEAVVEPTAVPASSEAQTTRRARANSTDVKKKNAVS